MGVACLAPAYPARAARRYLDSAQALIKYAACMHLLPQPPAVVVVLGLSYFLTADR